MSKKKTELSEGVLRARGTDDKFGTKSNNNTRSTLKRYSKPYDMPTEAVPFDSDSMPSAKAYVDSKVTRGIAEEEIPDAIVGHAFTDDTYDTYDIDNGRHRPKNKSEFTATKGNAPLKVHSIFERLSGDIDSSEYSKQLRESQYDPGGQEKTRSQLDKTLREETAGSVKSTTLEKVVKLLFQ